MSMSKKDFIALADTIKEHDRFVARGSAEQVFTPDQLNALAHFCKLQNPNFMRERWLGYINGKNGSNGSPIKAK
jgi:hypothetical protein